MDSDKAAGDEVRRGWLWQIRGDSDPAVSNGGDSAEVYGQIGAWPPRPTDWGYSRDRRICMRVDFEPAADGESVEEIQAVAYVEELKGWRVEVTVSAGEPDNDDEHLHVSRLVLEPEAGAKPIGSRHVMRALRLPHLLDEIDTWTGEPVAGQTLGPAWRRTIARPGRGGRDDLDYALWARRYVAALASHPTRPVQALIDEEADSGEFVTEGQIRARLNRARSRDLLTAAPPGQPGGELTDKAVRLLDRHDQGIARAAMSLATSTKPPTSRRKSKKAT